MAKITFEERVLNALQYEMKTRTPLEFVRSFFEHSFSLAQQSTCAITQWRTTAEELTTNMAMFPFTLHFHPVYLAAAFLAWAKQH